MPLGTCDGQGPNSAASDVRQSSRQAREHQLSLATNQVGDGGCNSSVGDMHHEAVGLQFEKLSSKVRQRACARRTVRQAARVLFHIIQERLEILRWQAGIDAQHIRRAANHAYRRKVFFCVIGQLARGGCRAMRGHIALHEGVAVGGCPRCILRRNDPTAAANVVDHHRLSQDLGPTLTQCASHHVGAAASSHGYDVTNGFGGKSGLSLSVA